MSLQSWALVSANPMARVTELLPWNWEIRSAKAIAAWTREWLTGKTNIYHERTVLGFARLLLRDWDPICIYGIPDATDKYPDKTYVVLTDEGATVRKIAGYFFTVATEHMGLTDRVRLAVKRD